MQRVLTAFLQVHECGKSALGQPKELDLGANFHRGTQDVLEDVLGVLSQRTISLDSIAQIQRTLVIHSRVTSTTIKGLGSDGSVVGVMPNMASGVRQNQSGRGVLRVLAQNSLRQLEDGAKLNSLPADLTVRENADVLGQLANEDNDARGLADVGAHQDWSAGLSRSLVRLRNLNLVHGQVLQSVNDDVVNGIYVQVSTNLQKSESYILGSED